MKKIVYIVSFLILFMPLAFSSDEKMKEYYDKYNNTTQGFYTIKDGEWIFNMPSKETLKKYTKDEQKKYKAHLKAEKYLNKISEEQNKRFDDFLAHKRSSISTKQEDLDDILKYQKVIKYNPEYWPAYYSLASNYFSLKKPKDAIKYADIYAKNWYAPEVYKTLAESYAMIQQYDKAYEYMFKHINSKETKYVRKIKKLSSFIVLPNDFLSLASYADKVTGFNTSIKDKKSKDYNIAKIGLESATKAEKFGITKIEAIRIKHSLYRKINDKQAVWEAKKLVELEPNFNNYITFCQYYTKYPKQYLQCVYNAKSYASTNQELNIANYYIIPIEQKKIDTALKKLNFYIKAPNWEEISLIKNKLGSTVYWSDRQDLFFKSTNRCIQNYTGKNLANCFKQVNTDQEKLTNILRDDWYRQEQLAIQDQVLYQQQMQTYYASQSAYSQDQSAYYLQKIYQNSLNSNN